MAAAVFVGAGGPEVIEVERRPLPEPGPGQVLIRVEAAGLNRADVQQRRGYYAPPPGASEIPGLEVAGTIAGYGRGVSEAAWPEGTAVCALLTGGGYAEYVAVPVSQVLHVPDGLDMAQAGALMETACTVVANLSHTVQVHAGDWVLVHGGSGGIGSLALQYLRELGARTIATGSSEAKLAWATAHGATHTVDYTREDFPERVAALTEGHGADVILDVVGAKYLDANVRSLATGGRLVIIGLVGGARAELDLGALLTKRASVHATTLRSRPEEQKAAIVASVGQRLWPLVEAGSITVEVDRTFPLMRAREAHEYFDSGEHRGKIVLTA
ncbi:NAD(P)H-quinone oxidoreductase [Galactobacter caseinivorans]|uniref:NAD(P)H-quinone oxidoreductase n=1 Tax=Galactobacter caseinivorans TaxID=2676123 RepID=A0A496PHQ4_9MICC|nr:NAD(P)H-quinone oxidoreductase [Galactobacter caseinivorans]RKW70017.1 NAD(P)H-quinone oxidoreductase [Galactobacter caseinivorans]